MSPVLLIFMIGVPIAEIAVFIEAGDVIGFWPTIAVIILTAMIGTFFLRYQGLSVLSKVTTSLHNNQMPVKEMFEGLCLLVAGALLLTPGFITDTVGFLLLIPPLREVLAASIINHVMKSGKIQANFRTTGAGFSAHQRQRYGPGGNNTDQGDIIDGDYSEIRTPEDHADDDLNPRLPPHDGDK